MSAGHREIGRICVFRASHRKALVFKGHEIIHADVVFLLFVTISYRSGLDVYRTHNFGLFAQNIDNIETLH